MKKALYIIVGLGIISLIVYAVLGGFKTVEISVNEKPQVHIAGTFFSGKIGSDTLQSLFMQSKKLVETEETASSIAIVYFGEADTKSGKVENFIGVVVGDDPIHKMPENWEIKSFSSKQSIKGCIEANVLAMPTPDDMLEDLRSHASERNIQTDSVFIEYYPGPNQLCVELLTTE
ncbi:hypothetical protein [Marivirga arenosa]|uniref:GyrI-like small molecule binding domain-containing protein n=1 Tax=Marivirga arenosa TaxID=3059076 RepID=A0AA51R9W3_9BACT|nr:MULTISPECIES: hypothetical protein [unclassified Marivirga]WKK78892.2 hypothetical protein QYS47_15230 [Marivirga sp. BKB1-2]WMN08016.1 hypothetical protein QYS48_30750 [Marivirga sp. ABR2-2]